MSLRDVGFGRVGSVSNTSIYVIEDDALGNSQTDLFKGIGDGRGGCAVPADSAPGTNHSAFLEGSYGAFLQVKADSAGDVETTKIVTRTPIDVYRSEGGQSLVEPPVIATAVRGEADAEAINECLLGGGLLAGVNVIRTSNSIDYVELNLGVKAFAPNGFVTTRPFGVVGDGPVEKDKDDNDASDSGQAQWITKTGQIDDSYFVQDADSALRSASGLFIAGLLGGAAAPVVFDLIKTWPTPGEIAQLRETSPSQAPRQSRGRRRRMVLGARRRLR